jgi:hypothetical protein
VDPTGRFAYVVNGLTNNVSAYTIDASTGALSPMATPTVAAGTNPTVHGLVQVVVSRSEVERLRFRRNCAWSLNGCCWPGAAGYAQPRATSCDSSQRFPKPFDRIWRPTKAVKLHGLKFSIDEAVEFSTFLPVDSSACKRAISKAWAPKHFRNSVAAPIKRAL